MGNETSLSDESLSPTRQEPHGCLRRKLADRGRDLPAIHVGHTEIRDHQVKRLGATVCFPQQFHALRTLCRAGHDMSVHRQGITQ